MIRLITCDGCGQEKPYYVNGLCKTCYGRHYMRQWRAANRERCNANSRAWRERNREKTRTRDRQWREENREKHCARVRRYYQKHKRERATYNHRYYQEHKEEHRAHQRRWLEQNPDRVAIYNARRQARKRALPDTLTAEQARQLLAMGKAMYPGEKLHLDHIVPLSRGGGTTKANMHAIPASLNISKQDKLPEEVYGQAEMII